MKVSVLITLLLFSFLSFAQVGIKTTTPQATLDVIGDPTITTSADGIIAPRLTLAQLNAKTTYGIAQTAALLYVTSITGATTTATALVNTIGYYYFNGTTW